MKCGSKRGKLMGSEGSMAIMVAVVMVGLLGMASFAIDLGQISTVRNELQNTSDSASLAAARALIVEETTGTNKATYRDATGAVTAATSVIQQAATDKGLTWDPNGYDISILFGEYKDHASSGNWTLIGDSSMVPATSPANAVQVLIKRTSGKSYGPVTNLFAGIFGSPTTEVSAVSRAAMGYTKSVYQGTVQVPLALPSSGAFNPFASKSTPGWWDGVVGPKEAVAATTKTIVFRDSGGYYNYGTSYVTGTPTIVDNSVTTASPLDPLQMYLFTVGSGDAVPGTIWDILEKIYTPSKTSSNPLYVAKLTLGQRIYPRSEFKYGTSYISPIFLRLRNAYYYKTTGSTATAPPAGTPWRVTMAVYGTTPNPLAARNLRDGFRSLARLLSPWPTEAFACYTMPPPIIYINGFVNADIVGVTYSSTCDNCDYTYPKTIASPAPLKGTTTYTNKKDCLARYPNSVWNSNTVTIKNVTDVSTKIPGIPNVAGEGGGLSNKDLNASAPSNVGSFASAPKIIPSK